MTFWLRLYSHEHSDENQNNSVKHLGVCPSGDKTFGWPTVQTEEAVFDLKAARDLQSVFLNYFLIHMSINRGAG